MGSARSLRLVRDCVPARRARSFIVSTLLVLGVALFSAACAGPNAEDARTFLIRTDTMEIAEVSERLITAIASQLEQSQSLGDGYPILGRVEYEPDPSDPAIQIMRCTAAPPAATDMQCILLTQQGDFMTARPITWESAAFYMHKVYVAPKSLFARVNPVKDFVAIDVFVFEELGLWQAVEEAIRGAAAQIGARPYNP